MLHRQLLIALDCTFDPQSNCACTSLRCRCFDDFESIVKEGVFSQLATLQSISNQVNLEVEQRMFAHRICVDHEAKHRCLLMLEAVVELHGSRRLVDFLLRTDRKSQPQISACLQCWNGELQLQSSLLVSCVIFSI